MKLAVEVTTCTVERTGVGYYTEHLVDALHRHRAARRRGHADRQPRAGARAAARKWAGRLRTGGAQLRYLWMQRDAGRMLEEAGADFALFPNYLAPLASALPLRQRRARPGAHPDAAVLQRRANGAHARRCCRSSRAARWRSAPCRRLRGATSSRCSASRRSAIVMLPGAPHPSCRPPDEAAIARVRAGYGIARPYVLTVGTLEPRKNLVTLAAARSTGSRDGGSTAASSSGDGRAKGWRDASCVRELALRIGAGRVHLLGYVPEDDLVALYGGAVAMAYAVALRGLRAAGGRGDGLRDAGGGDRRRGAARGGRRGGPLRPARRRRGAVATPSRRCSAIASASPRRAAPGLARAAQFSWTRSAETLWARARSTGPARRAPGTRASRQRRPRPSLALPPSGCRRPFTRRRIGPRRARMGAARDRRVRRPLRFAAPARAGGPRHAGCGARRRRAAAPRRPAPRSPRSSRCTPTGSWSSPDASTWSTRSPSARR